MSGHNECRSLYASHFKKNLKVKGLCGRDHRRRFVFGVNNERLDVIKDWVSKYGIDFRL